MTPPEHTKRSAIPERTGRASFLRNYTRRPNNRTRVSKRSAYARDAFCRRNQRPGEATIAMCERPHDERARFFCCPPTTSIPRPPPPTRQSAFRDKLSAYRQFRPSAPSARADRVPELAGDSQLRAVALAHTADMIAGHFFGHASLRSRVAEHRPGRQPIAAGGRARVSFGRKRRVSGRRRERPSHAHGEPRSPGKHAVLVPVPVPVQITCGPIARAARRDQRRRSRPSDTRSLTPERNAIPVGPMTTGGRDPCILGGRGRAGARRTRTIAPRKPSSIRC